MEAVSGAAFHAMYTKVILPETGTLLQNLAALRPELILPKMVDSMQEALSTLTEPHKLKATIHAFVAVSRTMVYPGPRYPEGTTHVIPMMSALLPGIDPNDLPKALLTFQFLSVFCTLVPLVDSSDAPR